MRRFICIVAGIAALVARGMLYEGLEIRGGSFEDANGNRFDFDLSGYVFGFDYQLPEDPGEHVCELDAHCNCVRANATARDIPEEYDPPDLDDMSNIYNWVSEGSLPANKAGKYVISWRNADGTAGSATLDSIAKSAAWQDMVQRAWSELAEKLVGYRVKWLDAANCPKENPQHAWTAWSCGGNRWSKCARCGESEGEERHSMPGGAWNETQHACACGRKWEDHGELVPDGSRVATSDGWRQTFRCPENCGYTKTVAHTHHHTDCGPCDAGDGCSEPCSCNGAHTWGGQTERICAHCVCETCEDCKAVPDDISLHSDWLPCGEDTEGDNDDGRAAGAHCQCMCKAFGHNANTDHDYQMPAGMDPYEDLNEEKHYRILGVCTRCRQRKSAKERHEYPEDVAEYKYVDNDTCKGVYRCSADGCGHVTYAEPTPHDPGATAVYVNVSPTICRRKAYCRKKGCGGVVFDDTHGHERGDGCKCRNGCWYRYEHAYKANACGIASCEFCGEKDPNSSGSHKEDVDQGETHACRCGAVSGAPHRYGAPVEVSRSGFIAHMKEVCGDCGHVREFDEDTCPCRGGKHVLNKNAATCACYCGEYGPTGKRSTSEDLHAWADTMNADGIQTCMCKCGRYHKQREYPASAVSSGEVCSRVCSVCNRSGSGLDIQPATEDMHDAFAQEEANRCGCRCGRIGANDSKTARFHYQNKAGLRGGPYCRCIGGPNDTTGGAFHFPNAREDCANICATRIGGRQHLAAKSKELSAIEPASKSDHTPYDGAACRCACGEVDGAQDDCPEKFHRLDPSSCYCWCRKKKPDGHVRGESCMCRCGEHHFNDVRLADGKCSEVCHGVCGNATNPAFKDRHDPDPNRCGCRCGAFGGSSYNGQDWHNGHGTPSCMCACGRYHNQSVPRSDCTLICSICGDGRTNIAFSDPVRPATEKEHTLREDGCGCKCGKNHLPHNMPLDRCKCFCGAEQIAHDWNDGETIETGAYTCETCGNTIRQFQTTYTCKRCGKTSTGNGESGHAPSCGQTPEGGDPDPPEPCFCGCADCDCDACKKKRGTCERCGDKCHESGGGTDTGGGAVNGGQTGGGGNLGDI